MRGFAFFFVVLSGCASTTHLEESIRLQKAGQYEQAMVELEKASEASKTDLFPRPEARVELLRRKVDFVTQLLNQARGLINKGEYDEAEKLVLRALVVDPSNERAQGLRSDLAQSSVIKINVSQAEKLAQAGDFERAEVITNSILQVQPKNPNAIALKLQIDERKAQAANSLPRLRDMYNKPLSVEFKAAPIKLVFEAIARTTGINFILDKEVRSDSPTTVFLKDTNFEDAIDLILLTSQLEKRVLNQNTIIVFQAGGARQRDFQDLVLRAFYLNNADPKVVAGNLKAMLKLKDVQPDEKLNAVYVRDVPDALVLAEKFIAIQDLAEPEVMLDVEVFEIGSSRLLELGIQYPTQLAITPLNAAGKPGNFLLNEIRDLNRSKLETNLGQVSLSARKSDGWSNVLANPSIRVKNREKAKVLIGDKVPVISTATSQGVVTESIQYIEVGVKLDVEPTIYLQDDIGIKISLEVSSLAREIRSPSGALAYQIGTRSATTALRLKDGETQILGGLISDDERSSAAKIPGLGDLPLIGRFFTIQKDDKGKSEILLAITPRLIRNVQKPTAANDRMWTGTETQLRTRPLLSQSLNPAAQPTGLVSSQPYAINPVGATPQPSLPNQSVSISADSNNRQASIPEATEVRYSWNAPTRAKAGEEFKLVLNVQSNGALSSMPMQFSYDKDAIEILSVQEGETFKKDGGGTNFSQLVDGTSGSILVGYSRVGQPGPTNSGSVITVVARFLKGNNKATLKMQRASPVTPIGRLVSAVIAPALEIQATQE
jgi:general secretion pathway protein D